MQSEERTKMMKMLENLTDVVASQCNNISYLRGEAAKLADMTRDRDNANATIVRLAAKINGLEDRLDRLQHDYDVLSAEYNRTERAANGPH